MTAPAFHSACDERGGTLTLIRCDSGFTFGGYTSTPWSSPPGGRHVTAASACLFSVVGPQGTVMCFPQKPRAPGHKRRAMFCSPLAGPWFGGPEPDMAVWGRGRPVFDDSSYCGLGQQFDDGGRGVTALTGGMNFRPVEIEVFAARALSEL